MREQEWWNGWFYRRMYRVVKQCASIRQVRLLMAACCRLKIAEFFDPRISIILEAVELCADNAAAEAKANALWDRWVTSPHPVQFSPTGLEGELGRVITSAWQLVREVWDEHYELGRYRSKQHAIAHAAFMSLREQPKRVFTGGSGDAVEYCTGAIDCAESLRLGVHVDEDQSDTSEARTEIRGAIANLFRDIFGNPFRPVTFDSDWRTSTAVALAKQMYESRDFGAMPILADALQDAGCDNNDILNHCRDATATHVRGCWGVDLVLGKG